MGKYRKKHKNISKSKYVNKYHSINISIFLILLVIVTITVGYSAFFASLEVNDVVAVMRAQVDIRVSGLEVVSSTSGVTSSYEEYNIASFGSNVNLPDSDSTITYNVEILNIGNVEMGISEITGLPSNLTYELGDYALGRILCDDNDRTQCTLGSRTTVPITIKYVQGMYDSSSTSFALNIGLTFTRVEYVARIGNNNYATLQLAVDAVPKNNTLTSIILLRNISERVYVSTNQNIWLDFAGLTISNSGNAPVFESSGNITITNGLIYSTASQGAINITTRGSLTISGGSIRAAGVRQAIYNNGGVVRISGSAYIPNVSNQRAAVQNHASGGSIIITGGTIISERQTAVLNETGTLIIGVKDGDISRTSPMLRGYMYGVNNSTGTGTPTPTNFSYYDGVISGGTAAIYDEEYISDKEDSYGIAHTHEYVSGILYDKAWLAHVAKVTFNPGDGNVNELSRNVEIGHQVGALPVATLDSYAFDGWFTAASGGTKFENDSIVFDDIELFAHWTHINDVYIAQIGNTQYRTLASAVAAVRNNTATSILLIRSTSENITVPATKNITFDLQSYTLSSPNDNAVIINNGICQFIGGLITTNSKSAAAINNNASGTFMMSGGSIVAYGLRQAIYNDGGKVTISGGYLEANTAIRATVQNNATGGSIVITGGTIYSASFSGVSNLAGNLFVGVKDGNINANSPLIIGTTYGIMNSATFKFYDGKIGGIIGAISGNINEREDNSNIEEATLTIDNKTYNVKYLS